jgi:hypothetical protein
MMQHLVSCGVWLLVLGSAGLFAPKHSTSMTVLGQNTQHFKLTHSNWWNAAGPTEA